ncbi:hypothetical protein COR50_19895 [Chitinophaga caeni]|uniref:CAAX prenyl protease 2/Lysostaphin resistance protein A-like domain-containing protein n=1 Tax=Chitinophaga caeni TaxID=2029983 RepID=A0A291QZI2_9BACT|nr:type II CAAX endopeptidase family protein [Chitinophaga caeni]ATL49253.1 hypothetical protein COR50_19895 [Chitinophaga caeni]
MKNFLQKIPVWLKVVLYFFILWLSTLLAALVPALNGFVFFLLVSVALGGLFLWSEDKSIFSLQFVPKSVRHWAQFFLGTVAGCGMLVLTTAITLQLTGDHWKFADQIRTGIILMTFVNTLFSAFVQEFVFRGYPFQALIRQYGTWIAQLAILIPFGFMHFHTGMTAAQMGLTMLTTGIGSILFGLAYIKTGHLMLPIGLHFGWNFAQSLIPRAASPENGSYGLIQITSSQHTYHTWEIIAPYLLVASLTILILYIVKRKPLNNELPGAISQAKIV